MTGSDQNRVPTGGGRVAGLMRLALLLFALLLVALADGFAPGWKDGLDELPGDVAWRISASKQPDARMVLIDVDEASLREIGPWPWPRSVMANLSRQLAAQGVERQIYDIVFETPRADDTVLAGALRSTRSTLAQIFVLDRGAVVHSGLPRGADAGLRCQEGWPQASGFIAPSAAIKHLSVGHITPRIDRDGAVRRLPALICLQQKAYPALALAGLSQASLQLLPAEGWLDPPYRLKFGPQHDAVLPLSATGDIRIPYRLHPDAFIAVSAADVMAGLVPQNLLQGRVAVVGSTALGVNDAVPTPFNGATPGMLIHAELYAGLLDRKLPYTPRHAWVLQLLVFALLSGMLLLVAYRARRARVFLPLLGVLGVALVVALHISALLFAQIWVGWVSVALPLLLGALFLAVHEHWRSRNDRERLFSHLSSYLPAAVASALALQRPSGVVQAERREVTVLIADIRNFSAYCENAPAEEVAAVLHTYIVIAQQVVEEYGGVLESMHGDSILALWPGIDTRAVDAARVLVKRAREFLPASLPAHLAPLALGAGVEAGVALIGSIGPQRRRTHTAMGATVTTAGRLQAMTADLAESVLIGPVLADAMPIDSLHGLGQFLLEGLRRPQHVFAPDT